MATDKPAKAVDPKAERVQREQAECTQWGAQPNPAPGRETEEAKTLTGYRGTDTGNRPAEEGDEQT